VLERAEQTATEGDYKRSLELYLCILHEMLALLESADDSDGDIGGVIESSSIKLQAKSTTDGPIGG